MKSALDLGDRILEIYKIKRNGSIPEQEQLKSHLRNWEAERAAERNETAAESQERRSIDIGLETKAREYRLSRLLSSNPFKLAPEDIFDIAVEKSGGGGKPLLIVSPILRTQSDSKGNDEAWAGDISDAICRTWERHDHVEDVALLEGALEKAVGSNAGIDFHMLQKPIRDLPVIFVAGKMDDRHNLWITVIAWNVVTTSHERDPLRLALPPYPLDTQGVVAHIIGIIDLLAQWFHLIRYGRKPLIRSWSDTASGEGRDLLAAQLLSAYDVLAFEDPESAMIHRLDRAELCLEAGLVSEATALGVLELSDLRSAMGKELQPEIVKLRRLATLFLGLEDARAYEECRSQLERAARPRVHRALGWTVQSN